jgi:hypothetical protein
MQDLLTAQTFHTAKGDEVDIILIWIVSVRDALDLEKPGNATIATLDGKIHIVMETRDEIRAMIADARINA